MTTIPKVTNTEFDAFGDMYNYNFDSVVFQEDENTNIEETTQSQETKLPSVLNGQIHISELPKNWSHIKKTPRILCLHDFGSNGQTLENQVKKSMAMSRLLKLSKDNSDVELVFPTGPHVLPSIFGISGHHENKVNRNCAAWFYYSKQNMWNQHEEHWKAGSDPRIYYGWQDTVEYLAKYYGTFDAVLGVGQGAVAAHLLTCEKEDLDKQLEIQWSETAEKFLRALSGCICVNGSPARCNPAWEDWNCEKLKTDSLHIVENKESSGNNYQNNAQMQGPSYELQLELSEKFEDPHVYTVKTNSLNNKSNWMNDGYLVHLITTMAEKSRKMRRMQIKAEVQKTRESLSEEKLASIETEKDKILAIVEPEVPKTSLFPGADFERRVLLGDPTGCLHGILKVALCGWFPYTDKHAKSLSDEVKTGEVENQVRITTEAWKRTKTVENNASSVNTDVGESSSGSLASSESEEIQEKAPKNGNEVEEFNIKTYKSQLKYVTSLSEVVVPVGGMGMMTKDLMYLESRTGLASTIGPDSGASESSE